MEEETPEDRLYADQGIHRQSKKDYGDALDKSREARAAAERAGETMLGISKEEFLSKIDFYVDELDRLLSQEGGIETTIAASKIAQTVNRILSAEDVVLVDKTKEKLLAMKDKYEIHRSKTLKDAEASENIRDQRIVNLGKPRP